MGSTRSQINKFMSSGSGQKEAIAKALSMKRKAKKMAEGGEVEPMESYDDNGVSFEDNRDSKPEENGPWPGTMVMKQKMANGGTVEGDAEEAGEATYPEGTEGEGLSESVQAEQMLASGLQKRRMKANDNSNSFEAFPGSHPGEKMTSGLEVKTAGMLGNKPELGWVDDGTEEPMASMPGKPAAMAHAQVEGVPGGPGLSEEARSALEAKKKKRRFMA